MLRKFLAALAATLVFAPAALAGGPVIYVDNVSTVVPQADVEAALPAFQTATSRDFARVWGTDAKLTTDPAFAVSADMEIIIDDTAPNCGCLGYHDVVGKRPVSYVYAETGAQYNESWQLTFTHEEFEMLADPWINRFANWNGRSWLVEVADQVESGFYAYKINGVVISDFVTPRWYNSKLKGPFDFTRGLKRAGQIGRHGYASYWDGIRWGQVFG